MSFAPSALTATFLLAAALLPLAYSQVTITTESHKGTAAAPADVTWPSSAGPTQPSKHWYTINPIPSEQSST